MITTKRSSIRTGKKLGPLAVAAVVVLSAGACGSSSSSSAPAATGAGTSPTTAAASGTGASSIVAAAQSAVRAAAVFPSTITVTTPLATAPPPTGKTIIYLQSQESTSTPIAAAIQSAAQAIGWTYKGIDYDIANPGTLVTSMMTALQYKPVAVVVAGSPEAEWQSVVPAYVQAGVSIIPAFVGPVTPSPAIIANLAGEATQAGTGAILANWIIADSQGKAHVLVATLPSFGVLVWTVDGYRQVMKGCTSCVTTYDNATIEEASSAAFINSIVTDLRENPSIKYVMAPDASLVPSLYSALSAAGLTGIKITGAGSDVAEQAQLTTGQASAFTTNALAYVGYQAVDVAIRHLEGMTFPSNDQGVFVGILTASTPNFTPEPSEDFPADYQQQFKSLWKVG